MNGLFYYKQFSDTYIHARHPFTRSILMRSIVKDIVTLRGAKEDVEKCAAHLKKLASELTASNYHEEVIRSTLTRSTLFFYE